MDKIYFTKPKAIVSPPIFQSIVIADLIYFVKQSDDRDGPN